MMGAIRVVSVERGHEPARFLYLSLRWRRPRCMAARWLASSGTKPFWCRPLRGDLGARAPRLEPEDRVLVHLPRAATRLLTSTASPRAMQHSSRSAHVTRYR